MGRLDSSKLSSVRLSGESILDEHCYFENMDGKVVLYAMPGSNTVRGRRFYKIALTYLYQFLNGKQLQPEVVSSKMSPLTRLYVRDSHINYVQDFVSF